VRRRSFSVTATALAILCGSVVLSAGSAGATTGGQAVEPITALSITSYGDMAVDGGHVFVSDGAAGRIVVTDPDGTQVAELTGLPGVQDLELSPDGGTLYAAVSGADEIVSVDTATLAVTGTYLTGAGTAPARLAFGAGTLWFGYTADGHGDLGALDLSGAEPVVRLGLSAGVTWGTPPALVTDPADPTELVAVELGVSGGPLVAFDTSSGIPIVRTSAATAGDVEDLGFDPAGQQLVTALPDGVGVYGAADLGHVFTKFLPAGAHAVAAGPSGWTAAAWPAGENDVLSLFTGPSGLPHTRLLLNPAAQVVPRGLAWAPDGNLLFAVTRSVDGSGYQLREEHSAEATPASLTLQAPATARRGRVLTVTGTLTPADPGAQLTVTRYGPAGTTPVTLPAVTVGADGTFCFTDVPRVAGGTIYKVVYNGSTSGDVGTAEQTVEVDVTR
jgi:hypothetical protein